MRATVLMLSATLALVVLPQALSLNLAAADTNVKDRTSLVKRVEALRRADTQGVAKADLKAAQKWLVLAGWAADEKNSGQQRRMLRLAEIQLQLAQRLVTLARLQGEVKRLERALSQTKRSMAKDSKRLKERKELLHILRFIR